MDVVLVYLVIKFLQLCISKQVPRYRLCEIHTEALFVFRSFLGGWIAYKIGQYTYNITLWSVRVTIFAAGKQHLVLCVLLSYVALSVIRKH